MNSFEKYLKNVDKKQKVMIYLSVVLIVIMALNQILPAMMEKEENIQTSINTMKMEVINNSTKKLKRDLVNTEKLFLQIQEKVNTQKQRINFLLGSLYKVKFAFFRESELARSLDEILKESLSKNIKINYIKNSDEKVAALSELVQYKKSMNIDGQGSYKNILEFINYVENLDLLLKITQISLEETSDNVDVHFTLSINFYGVGL